MPAGVPFDRDSLAADYSLQVMIGYESYEEWKGDQAGATPVLDSRRQPKDGSRRDGPPLVYH